MLEPDNRVLLSEALRPPPGARLDRAVGTTFTIDLTSALTVPLAFAGAQITKDPEPIALLEALRMSADRIDVFYQAGAIRVPQGSSNIVALLEDAIHPVRRPRPGYLFHPVIFVTEWGAPTEKDPFPAAPLGNHSSLRDDEVTTLFASEPLP